MVVDLVDRALLDDAPLLHDHDAVADGVDDVEVVADEQVAQIEVPPQIPQQIEDLGLYGDVEGGDRLVRDQKARALDQGGGDGDALPLPARELGGP